MKGAVPGNRTCNGNRICKLPNANRDMLPTALSRPAHTLEQCKIIYIFLPLFLILLRMILNMPFSSLVSLILSRVIRKPAFCIRKNKGAYQLCCYHTSDQRLCFPNTRILQSLNFLNSKFQTSSHLLWLYSLVCV